MGKRWSKSERDKGRKKERWRENRSRGKTKSIKALGNFKETNNSAYKTLHKSFTVLYFFLFSIFQPVLPHHYHHQPLKGGKDFVQGFGKLTLCGRVTVMAVGCKAQGQGGSREMYFYSCFQGTVLVQRLMSQERCKPPEQQISITQPGDLLISLNYLHGKCDCFSDRLKLF